MVQRRKGLKVGTFLRHRVHTKSPIAEIPDWSLGAGQLWIMTAKLAERIRQS